MMSLRLLLKLDTESKDYIELDHDLDHLPLADFYFNKTMTTTTNESKAKKSKLDRLQKKCRSFCVMVLQKQ